MEKIEKPKSLNPLSQTNYKSDQEILEEVVTQIINHNPNVDRVQFQNISVQNVDPILYKIVKVRLAFGNGYTEDFKDYMNELMKGTDDLIGFPEYMIELVNEENFTRLDMVARLANPLIYRADCYSKGICLICLLIWENEENWGCRDRILMELMSLTFDDRISLFCFNREVLRFLEKYIGYETLGDDLLNVIRRVQYVNNHEN